MSTLLAFAVAAAAAAEPYSVEDSIRHQRAGFVHFLPDGSGVVVEYGNKKADIFGPRDKFFWSDLRGVGNARLLFPDEGYGSFSPSPDSRYAAYFHYHGDSLDAAVYDFRTHRSIEFDVVPNDRYDPKWVSDHEVVFSTVSPGASRFSFSDQMSLQWRKYQEGRSTTASAMGSGRHAARPENSGGEGIIVADVRTGAIRPVAPGGFLDQAISPSGARLAAIRRVPAIVNPQLPIGPERGPLVVFDINRNGAARTIGDSPNAVPGSLRWSPGGRRLAFLTAADNESGDQSQVWIYDATNGAARRVEIKGLRAARSNNAPANPVPGMQLEDQPPFAWLGEELVILAQTDTPHAAARADWFVLRADTAPINLTAQFSQVPKVVAATRTSLLMSADGQVWEVKANGQRRLLTGELGQRVRVAHDPHALRAFSFDLPTSSLVLEDESSQGAKTVYFLDIASGQVTGRVKAPAQDARIRAISTAFKRVAFSYSQNDVDVISMADASGASREILRLNEYRKDKEIGTFVKIDHQERKTGRKLVSWLLLPPGYRKGPPLPTVVHIYPGTTYGSTPPQLDPTDKPLLLAAHGYAVLFASLPIDKSVLPREPLEGLADSVLLAVDAAKSQGYVDGDRLAIQGHSYGGYGTLGVIGQTDRFKAAVALSGSSDLLSDYGQPRIYDRLSGEFDGILDATQPMGWAETGQGGMGGLPWRDPQRYLRNSPLLYVDTIHTPVMLVHGDLDSAVPFSQAEEMFTALYRLNKDAVFVRYWGEAHQVPVSPANIRDFWARMYAWYDTYIGPPFDVARALATSH